MTKVKMEDISLNIYTGTMIYVDIDCFRFVQDGELSNPEVYFDNSDNFEFLDEIEIDYKVENVQDLKEVALKWIIKNVEIAPNLEEVQAYEQQHNS